jgi:hypothetical protein
MLEWLGTLRSLGFGAMFGGGVGLIVALSLELYADKTVNYEAFAAAGALIFGSIHMFLEKWIIATFLRPIGLFICYYSSLFQVYMLIQLRRKTGYSSPPTIKQLNAEISRLTTAYFQGKCP